MTYEIGYFINSAYDFIVALDSTGHEFARVLDSINFPNFKDSEGTYNIDAIRSYFNEIEDVSSWDENDMWQTISDIYDEFEDDIEFQCIYMVRKEV